MKNIEGNHAAPAISDFPFTLTQRIPKEAMNATAPPAAATYYTIVSTNTLTRIARKTYISSSNSDIISFNNSRQILRINNSRYRLRPSVDDGLSVYAGRVGSYFLDEARCEEALCDGEEDGAAEELAEDDDAVADGDFTLGEHSHDTDESLWKKLVDS
jgi:hypothetical protein